MRVTAPGKVLWAGEYAILDGHPAIISAVDRRVVATLADGPGELSPFLEAVRDELGETVSRVRVDSSALASDDGGRKLGLGSSAASVVAATAAVLGTRDLARVHAVAHRAHARAQAPRGSRGSGADVAASVYGGLLRVMRPDDESPLRVERIASAPPPTCLLWTGVPADTPSLVAHVRTLRARAPDVHAACMADLGSVAERLGSALAEDRPAAVVAAIADGAAALAALAERSGAPLVPECFAQVQALAGRYGGAAKPTGAGGGDLLLCVFTSSEARDAFRTAAECRGMIPVSANVEHQGVLAEPDG